MNIDLTRKRDELADKRSKRQCTTGNQDLDKAIAWYLKIGFEDGFDAAVAEMQAQQAAIINDLKDMGNNKFDEIQRLAKERDSLKAQLDRCNEIAERDGKDYSDLKAQIDLAVKALEYYVNNCDVCAYELAGGDGAPSGFLPYDERWKKASEALEQIQKMREGTSINEIINKTKYSEESK